MFYIDAKHFLLGTRNTRNEIMNVDPCQGITPFMNEIHTTGIFSGSILYRFNSAAHHHWLRPTEKWAPWERAVK
jgi:hypothetical protein